MDTIFQLFAYLLLTLIGFVMPILAIILTVFGQGFAKLASQYEAEGNLTKKKLADQLKKTGETESIDEKQILATIKELKHLKRTADAKLRLLSPKKAIISLIAPLTLAFCVTLPILVKFNVFTYSSLILAILATAYAIVQFWTIMDIIVEAKKIQDLDAKDDQRRVPELLAQIANSVKEGGKYFLDKVHASFLGVELKKDATEVSLTVDNKTQVPISFTNSEVRMAKDVELGFIFPMEFLVEKGGKYNIYTSGDEQIVRYSSDRVHGNTQLVLSPLVLTPLKKGQFDIKTFVKGENIETKNRTLKLTVQ